MALRGDLVVLRLWLNSVILRVFFNLNDSVILTHPLLELLLEEGQ